MYIWCTGRFEKGSLVQETPVPLGEDGAPLKHDEDLPPSAEFAAYVRRRTEAGELFSEEVLQGPWGSRNNDNNTDQQQQK